MKFNGRTGEYLELKSIDGKNCHNLDNTKESELVLLWFVADDNQLQIDGKEYTFRKNDWICLTEFHRLGTRNIKAVKLLRFNRPFYCILDHDSEVGCKGALFFGSAQLPFFQPDEKEIEILEAVWKMLEIEMESKDELQLEMLQMMLKRILILCTRIYKKKLSGNHPLDRKKMDLIREFNFLVETHFKEKNTVQEYADLLNKSPKTISNIFKKIGTKSPLQFIQDRKMLEARRLLTYTDKTVSEIGYDIGFNDIQTFSRFFKKQEGLSPSDYRT